MTLALDPKVWGPHYWFFLHTIALSYPKYPNTITKKKYYEFIQNLPLFLPIESISTEFSKLIDMYPVAPYLDNKESFIKWVHFIHNKVNVILGKEEISYETALNDYLEMYIPKPLYYYEKMKINKYYIFIIFLFLCLFFIYFYY
jgi:hypothetical protein